MSELKEKYQLKTASIVLAKALHELRDKTASLTVVSDAHESLKLAVKLAEEGKIEASEITAYAEKFASKNIQVVKEAMDLGVLSIQSKPTDPFSGNEKNASEGRNTGFNNGPVQYEHQKVASLLEEAKRNLFGFLNESSARTQEILTGGY